MSSKPDNSIFIDRELSWLDFNHRVLALAKDKDVPLGEQLKFAAIYGSNLDEFFMVRVGSLYDQLFLKDKDSKNQHSELTRQLNHIMEKTAALQQVCDNITARLYTNLEKQGYKKINFDDLSKDAERFWKKYFINEIFPVLSPQVIDRRHPFPFLRNQEIYLGCALRGKNDTAMSYGVVPISSQFERLILIRDGSVQTFALVEELILHFAHHIFEKNSIQSRCLFRVTRSADITMDEAMFDQDIDYREVMGELLKKRRKLAAVRLQTWPGSGGPVQTFLCQKLQLPANQCFAQQSSMDLSFFFRLSSRIAQDNRPELAYPPAKPMQAPADFRLSQAVQSRDVLIAYPYQSMRPFIQMLEEAAADPEVISIKMTLYRVARDSKIVQALISAAENGKEVVTIVELRARFDEQNNIDWSKQLEKAGCTVIYGFTDYKVHSKLTLITKKKGTHYEYISQIGTGNYNEKTSEQYTDLSFVTSDHTIGEEVAAVFNNLAVERLTDHVDELLVAPLCFKSVLINELQQEIDACKEGKPGRAILKCNSMNDPEIIEKLQEASCAGVPVDMIIRGICCMRAGVPGMTENIRVRSIVGRYLEHSRIYCFGQGERMRVYIASGDFLTRNTERRVEVGVRVRDSELAMRLMKMLQLQLDDNVNARVMQADGSYTKVKRTGEEPVVDSQMAMYALLEDAWPQPAAKPVKVKARVRPEGKAPSGVRAVLSRLFGKK